MVQEMRRHSVAECVHHRGTDMRYLGLEVGDQLLDSSALEIALRSAKVTRDYRKLARGSVLSDVRFSTVSQWPDNCVAPVNRTKFRRHRLHGTDVKKVQ